MAAEVLTPSPHLIEMSPCRRLSAILTLVVVTSFMSVPVFAQTTAPAENARSSAQTAQPQQPPAASITDQQPSSTAPSGQPSSATEVQPPVPQPVDQQVQPVAPQEPATSQATDSSSSAAVEPLLDVDTGDRADIPHNLSPWGMFMAADWVVKGVMIGLAVASLVTWTVWLAKSLELFGARVRARSTLKIVHKAKTLSEAMKAAEKKTGPAALMLRMAAHEMKLSDGVVDYTDGAGIKERVDSVLSRIEAHAGRRMSRGTGVLASIGSVSPFVGLFGTVWGIMNSFISISESQTTNLAVVAPGIAEALLATAIGLVAAIPAVVIYNIFARSITGYRHLLGDVAAGVERLVSRDLDFRRVPPGSAEKPAVSLVGR